MHRDGKKALYRNGLLHFISSQTQIPLIYLSNSHTDINSSKKRISLQQLCLDSSTGLENKSQNGNCIIILIIYQLQTDHIAYCKVLEYQVSVEY